ncbi:MAG: NAD(P)H-binding protein [Ignavibacteria bacterium]
MQKPKIFITGGTGYIGKSVINKLLENDFEVTALIRNTSKNNLSEKCKTVYGDALDSRTYQDKILPNDTFIHLVGVSHPGPQKYKEFRSIDLVSIEQAIKASEHSGIKNFIYLSVANPAPIMKEYIKIRLKGEELLSASDMNCSIIRPWYVIGPGHY